MTSAASDRIGVSSIFVGHVSGNFSFFFSFCSSALCRQQRKNVSSSDRSKGENFD